MHPRAGCEGFNREILTLHRRPLELPALLEPLVSVLMPSHNYERFVEDAVRSVFSQTYGNWELIVYDDGSSDGSLELLHRLAAGESRMTVLSGPQPRGQGAALDAAWAESRGRVLCYLDADDLFRPRKLEVVAGMLSDGSAGFAVHPVQVVDENRRPLQVMPLFRTASSGWMREEILARGGRWRTVPSSGVSFRRELGSALFPIRSDLMTTGADGFTSMLLPLLTEVAVSREPLSEYRIHGQNAYGTRRLAPATIEKALDELGSITASVNRRLEELGEGITLNVQDNLLWHQNRFIQAVLEPSGPATKLARLRKLLGELWKDDLSSAFVKVSGTLLYSIAPLLPRGLRAGWLSLGLGLSRFKQVVAKAIRVRD